MNENAASAVMAVTTIVSIAAIIGRSTIKGLNEWADNRRRIAIKERELTETHAQWDRDSYAKLVENGIDTEIPPPLF